MTHPTRSEDPLVGRLQGIGVPALIRELSRRRATGRLHVENGSVSRTVFMEHGQIVFTASTDPGNDIVSYEWDWTYTGAFSPDDSGVLAYYTFPEDGLYTVALRVTDDNAAFDITTTTLSIAINTLRTPSSLCVFWGLLTVKTMETLVLQRETARCDFGVALRTRK